MSVPVALNRVHNNGTAASEGQVIPSSTPGAGGGLDAGDLMTERVSMGGESVNSSEYETVSMMEETGEVRVHFGVKRPQRMTSILVKL